MPTVSVKLKMFSRGRKTMRQVSEKNLAVLVLATRYDFYWCCIDGRIHATCPENTIMHC